jgi:hypothetical protein
MRKLILATLLLGTVISVNAQSGTNSPYSQYGLGVLSDQTSGFNRGMNGVGLGFHEHNQINYLNPASYSAIDSLSFILDAGISGQITNFEENGVKKNANNANFEYVVAGFRAAKHLGVSFGVLPFTNVGYNYTSTEKVGSQFNDATYTNTYNGEGGLHQVYLGVGWAPVKGLAVGANVAYIWGDYNKYVSNAYSNSNYNTLIRTYSTQVNSYKLDFGIQYTAKLSKKDWATIGATYSPGHNLGATADMNIISNNSQTSASDTTFFSIDKAFELPHMYGVGLMWNHNDQWKIGFDYTLQKWGSLEYPRRYVNVNDKNHVLDVDGAYADRSKFNLGMQYCYGEYNRHFFKRLRYRAGVSYATSYYKVNGIDGPKEISVSAGFGIPIMNNYNHRSFLNISGQWVKSSAKDLIKENTFRLNIGFTFNEEWFRKWRMK